MNIKEKIEIVTKLQKISSDVFNVVIKSLKVGMSEVDIAELFREEFSKRGITDFWYDVPLNVLIGVERFKIGTTTSDYSIKSPSHDVVLKVGDTFYADLAPIDSKTKIWGDFASMIAFEPRKSVDDEQIAFLKEIREIQLAGISMITSQTTGADVANHYLSEFKKHDIELLDVRNNVGHSMHAGPKDKAERVWLDQENTHPLGEGIFTIEPGGARGNLVGRFEECIYIPREGPARIL